MAPGTSMTDNYALNIPQQDMARVCGIVSISSSAYINVSTMGTQYINCSNQPIEGTNALRAFQDLHAKNKLTLRVLHMIPADNLEHAVTLGVQSGLGDD